MRRSPLVRWCIRGLFAGDRSIAYPGSPFRLYYDGYRNIGVEAHGVDHCEEEEKRLVSRILTRLQPAVVWDIGANIGTWSLFMSTVMPQARIRCFEPDPVNLKFLTRNQTGNSLANWTIRPVALSDRRGHLVFMTDPTTGTTGSLARTESFSHKFFAAPTKEITVETSTIDDEIRDGADAPEFIKCDVEGHELAVFLGARETLARHHPVILFEDSGQVGTAELLRTYGYLFFNMRGDRIEEPAWNTMAVHVTQATVVE